MRIFCVLALAGAVGVGAAGRALADDVPPATRPAVNAADPAAFHCDGTDFSFFDEMQKNGALGYGETWDEHICDEGSEVYAEGADARWKALRTPRHFRLSP